MSVIFRNFKEDIKLKSNCGVFVHYSMNLLQLIVLVALLQQSRSEPQWLNSFPTEQSKANNTIILGEIITNYINNYFSEDEMFVSMISKTSRNNQSHVDEEFFNELFSVLDQAEFAHNLLDQLNNVTFDNRNAFNLIVVDDSSVLS